MKAVRELAPTNNIQRIFEAQKANQYAIGNTTARERKAKLEKLRKAVEIEFRDEIRQALKTDFHKHKAEVDLAEIFPVTSEIKDAKRHLSKWLRPQRVKTPIAFAGGSSWIQYEPKGVCLIISPWNFPINLTFGPLISAIAAGNTAMIKPSEHTPNASAVIKKIIESIFDESEVAVIEGGIETSTELLKLPFNHIFFTGAPEIGKIVMTAAAKNLASVTLELGGKSPTIVDETADIKMSAKRIAWGKFSNSGQVCIAPDYIFVHESKHDEFVKLLKQNILQSFGEKAEESESFTHIVNNRHLNRLKGYLDDAIAKGAKIAHGGKIIQEKNYLEPTLVENAPFDSELMKNEIFGPILPIFPYKNISEVIDYIRDNEKPLALYIFSSDTRNIKHILQNTRAGGTCINHNEIHFFNGNLPFGGVNNSGIGKGHGKFGFEAFSNARGIYRQHIPGALELLLPPYNNFKEKLIDLTIKWF
ncbi:MAG: aldehyde dehydrogenase family protein [Pyrinomonadaceae bacterium]|nr:aldehyde dehydrogenase family protein [Pyrinomonadaceae bacterium]